jgi:hypothetical protein
MSERHKSGTLLELAASYDSNQSSILVADVRLCIYCNEHSHQARNCLTAADGDKSSND